MISFGITKNGSPKNFYKIRKLKQKKILEKLKAKQKYYSQYQNN